jgi:hypothetical protein
MASRYYGVERGQTRKDVVEGSSTNSTGIELVVDLTKVSADGYSQREILLALEYIKEYIQTKAKFPPA